MALVGDLVKRLNETYDAKDFVAVAIWTTEDVIMRGRERGITITQEQAEGILDLVERKQDCELGISWMTIDVFTDDYFNE